MFGFFKKRRRVRWRSQPLPSPWRALLERHVPYYGILPEGLRDELDGHLQVILHEKNFEGCGGLQLTDRMRLTVAAYAGLLLLCRDTGYYPLLHSVLIYPSAFVVNHPEEDDLGIVDEEEDIQEGESWDVGAVILSWKDILRDTRAFDGRNVILHEFAHQLFDAGELHLDDPGAQAEWTKVLEAHFERHVHQVERRRKTFIDPYGAENSSEFFAVITEAFFEMPEALRENHPELYEQLCLYYRQNPVRYFDAQKGS